MDGHADVWPHRRAGPGRLEAVVVEVAPAPRRRCDERRIRLGGHRRRRCPPGDGCGEARLPSGPCIQRRGVLRRSRASARTRRGGRPSALLDTLRSTITGSHDAAALADSSRLDRYRLRRTETEAGPMAPRRAGRPDRTTAPSLPPFMSNSPVPRRPAPSSQAGRRPPPISRTRPAIAVRDSQDPGLSGDYASRRAQPPTPVR
jgi:hypothetical protein